MESTFNLQPSTKIHANAVLEEVVHLKCSVLELNNHLGLCFVVPGSSPRQRRFFNAKFWYVKCHGEIATVKSQKKKGKDDFTSVSLSSKQKTKANHLKHQFCYLLTVAM